MVVRGDLSMSRVIGECVNVRGALSVCDLPKQRKDLGPRPIWGFVTNM